MCSWNKLIVTLGTSKVEQTPVYFYKFLDAPGNFGKWFEVSDVTWESLKTKFNCFKGRLAEGPPNFEYRSEGKGVRRLLRASE